MSSPSLHSDVGLSEWLPSTLGQDSSTKSSGSSCSVARWLPQFLTWLDYIDVAAKLAVSFCSFSLSSEKMCLSFSSEKMHSFKCKRVVCYIWLSCFLFCCFRWLIFALKTFLVVFKKCSDLLLEDDDSWSSSSFWFPCVLCYGTDDWGLHKVVALYIWGDFIPFEDFARPRVKAVRRSIWFTPPNWSTKDESTEIIFSCYCISCASLYECSQFFSAI